MHDSSVSLDPFRCILGDRLSDRGHVQKTEDREVVEEEGGGILLSPGRLVSQSVYVSEGGEAPARVATV